MQIPQSLQSSYERAFQQRSKFWWMTEAAHRRSWTREAVLFMPVQLGIQLRQKRQSDMYAQMEDTASSAALGFISERSRIDPLQCKCASLRNSENVTLFSLSLSLFLYEHESRHELRVRGSPYVSQCPLLDLVCYLMCACLSMIENLREYLWN